MKQASMFDELMSSPAMPAGEKLKLAKAATTKQPKQNPCLALYGPGPEGTKCATCKHLAGLKYSHTYWKCTLRKLSRSAATDHRKNWPACAKYEQGEPQEYYQG